MAIAIETVSGDEITPWLPALARLRIRIFRDWPYLYEGDEEYENRYLQKYAVSRHGVVVLALAGGEVIGASTGLPLRDADAEFRTAFNGREPVSPDRIFYFGESVLRDDFRGQGIGHSFFDEREAFARDAGYAFTTFCAVQRPAEHPLRPVEHRQLDDFWRRRGYEKITGVLTEYRWQDIGEPGQSPKLMQFWGRGL